MSYNETMTRINLVPVDELMDQHLIAEYREITMVPGSLKRTLVSKGGYNPNKVKNEFTLNSGHVYFFYNKGKYLNDRYQDIIAEMKKRGFNPDNNRKFPVDVFKDNNLFGDWTPSDRDLSVVRERIEFRISKKPDWYRKTKHI